MGHDDDRVTKRASPGHEAAGPKRDLLAGALVGEYVVGERIASGGFGTVYAARHRVLDRRAAVKVLRHEPSDSPEMVERFVREARAVNRISHPNIVDIYEFGHLDDGRPYYVMELVEGRDLGAVLRERGRMSPPEALALLEPVCAALQAAHDIGVIHRDLKAENILVEETPGARRVKLHDFGIAKLLDPSGEGGGLTSVARRMGTPHAMAPEQIRGEAIDGRTDLYAMGVLLFQMLTGVMPFEAADDAEVERLHLEVEPPRPSTLAAVSPAIDALVLRCLHKDRARRFASVAAFLDAFRQAVAGAASAPATPRRVVGIYVELRPAGDAHGGEPVERLPVATAEAARALAAAGFAVVLRLGGTLLATRVLDPESSAERAGRADALRVAAALRADLAASVDCVGLEVGVCVHVDTGAVRQGPSGAEVLAGPILRVATWAPREPFGDARATAPAAEGVLAPRPGAAYLPIPRDALR